MRKNLGLLNDADLLIKLHELNFKEAKATAEVLLHLREVELRRIFRKQGFSSMFDFCCRELRYSESAAHRRLSAARLVTTFPELLDMLCRKEVNITTLSFVSTLLTPETYAEIMPRIRGKSQREAERVLAGYRPRTRVRERIKPVAIIHPESAAQPEQTIEERVEFAFTLGSGAFSQFEELKALLSSKFPHGVSAEQVFSEALEIALNKLSPRKRAARRAVRHSRKKDQQFRLPAQEVKEASQQRSRNIPTQVRDEVYVRDGGCCTYVGTNGIRCSSKHKLHYHHKIPFAKGGAHSADNISLLCAPHNALHAEEDFGLQYMGQFRRTG